MRGKVVTLAAALLVMGTPLFAHAPDSDNDGVKDRRDACANTPTGAKVDKTGCPIDSDSDGVANGIDRCTKTPSGWSVDEFGCPNDTDRDGVVDAEDMCPATLEGARPDTRGCPTDADNDQVFDGLDRCASTQQGYRVDAYGCPIDSDHDGVNDAIDQCADTRPRATVDETGCVVKTPLVFEQGEKVKLEGVTFDKNKIEVPEEADAILREAAASLNEYPDVKFEVGVHTDKAGTAAKNMELSRRRAEYVKNYLVALGVDESRIKAKGYGEKGQNPDRYVELTRIQ